MDRSECVIKIDRCWKDSIVDFDEGCVFVTDEIGEWRFGCFQYCKKKKVWLSMELDGEVVFLPRRSLIPEFTFAISLSSPALLSTYTNDEVRKYQHEKRLRLLTSTLTTRLSFPSLRKEWGCPLSSAGLSPLIKIRVQRSCSIVTKALLICAYLETRNVAKCRANRSGLRIWGEIFARSEKGLLMSGYERERIVLTVRDVLDLKLS